MNESTAEWVTEIAEVREDEIVVKGYKLSELIGRVTFVDMIFLIFNGGFPSPERRQVLEAMLVSVIEHGISPSTILTRTLASCGTPIQAAVAGGVLSIGDWHGGAAEQLAKLLHDVVSETAPLPADDWEARISARMSELVRRYRLEKRHVEGFGHPQHRAGDMRAQVLLNLADRLRVSGPYTAALRALGVELSTAMKRPMPPNVNGAFACLVLDLGFPWQAARGFVITPRTMSLTAHAVEELQQGGRWRHSKTVSYTGPPVRSLGEPPR